MALPRLHPAFQQQREYIGHEQQPLLVIDSFLENAESLIEYALQRGEVVPAAGYYPGLRSPVPDIYKQVLIEHLGELICENFSLQLNDIKAVDSYYSLVNTPPKELHPVQQIPHFDKPYPNEIAIIHYLCDGNHGGTSFYRHRQTQFEYVDKKRQDEYLSTVNSQIRAGRLPCPPRYINGDTELFERIATKSAKFNRLLIYRCSSLHSGNIGEDYSFDMNPTTGRFTIASFLHC